MYTHQINVTLTARDTNDRLAQKAPLSFRDDPQATENSVINVYDEVKYQEWIGFGGAFTEAAADTFYKLPEPVQEQVLEACFDARKGLAYTFCRTHMNSCDFSLGNYADAPIPGDVELKSFSMEREKQALIPMMQAAAKRAGFKLLISPWSPEPWMKDTGEMNRGGKLLPQYRDAWALHFVKFIQALEREGLPVWGLTIQNEPNATQTWDSCRWTGEEEAAFIAEHLAPALERHGLNAVKIMVWDHNKERVFERAKTVMSNAGAAPHVWGVGFHWYSGDHFEALDAVHQIWPGLGLVFTEGCVEYSRDIEYWAGGEAYGHDILGNLNHHTRAWCDWNLLLDHRGGPNHAGNYCSAPLMASADYQSVEYQPSYWYIGHFSRFIPEGSVRIASTRFSDALECAAFLRPDGSHALVAFNRGDEVVPWVLRFKERVADVVAPSHSIQTLEF